MSDYTPSMTQVETLFRYGAQAVEEVYPGIAESFDRWLAEHDRQVRADEREQVAQAIESVTVNASQHSLWIGGMREAVEIARTAPGNRWMLTEPCR